MAHEPAGGARSRQQANMRTPRKTYITVQCTKPLTISTHRQSTTEDYNNVRMRKRLISHEKPGAREPEVGGPTQSHLEVTKELANEGRWARRTGHRKALTGGSCSS